nr:MAG TPA: hypothetical protein [Caudoviricetes sp.]
MNLASLTPIIFSSPISLYFIASPLTLPANCSIMLS